jgi:hypothetical protein
MDALGRSAELLRRGDKLRARSVRARAAADKKVDNSRQLIAAAAKARAAVRHAHGQDPGGRAVALPPAMDGC